MKHTAEHCYAKCQVMLSVIYKPCVLSDVMLNIIMLNVVMPNVVILNVVMLNVVAP